MIIYIVVGMEEDSIYKLIEEYLPSKSKEKSEHGEVFTPVSMITSLYDNFPASAFTNKDSVWLDPASGIGNLLLVAFFYLMNGLRKVISNKELRKKHIIEKMLYMTEINKKNVKICIDIFKKICPSAKVNIYEGDFLKFKPESIGWPNTYNYIVGNPPYNIGGIGLEGLKRTHIPFTKNALELLSKNEGCISYICPPSYRETNTPMNSLFQEYKGNFLYIKIYGAEETHSLFHIQGRVDAFIYQLTNKNHTTIINDEYGIITKDNSIDLTRHIPNFGHSIFDKLYKKVKQLGKVDAFRNTEMSSVKSDTFGCNGKNKIMHLIISKGRRVFKSIKKHSLASTPKILINGLGVPYVFYDKDGAYGPSQSPVIILKPSLNVVSFLKSEFFSFIAWGLRLTGNNNLPYLFDYIPNVKTEKNSYKTMEDIKRGIQLTDKEVAFIRDNFKKYEYEDKDIIEKCANKTKKRVKKTH